MLPLQRVPKLGRIKKLFLLCTPPPTTLDVIAHPLLPKLTGLEWQSVGAGDGGGKRLAIISLGTICEPKKCLWRVRAA